MTTKILALLVMLLLSASLAGAAVCEDETDATGGYTVTPAKDAGEDGIRWIYDTITQGETNWHSKIVSTNINTLNVDLDWGDTTDSLRLKIYTPDGYVLGPYFDDDDGATDGEIDLDIYNPNGITEGTWRYEVYGYSVVGTEDYYI